MSQEFNTFPVTVIASCESACKSCASLGSCGQSKVEAEVDTDFDGYVDVIVVSM